MYEFSLDRKRIILLVSGLVLAAILLFAAGLTVGLAHSGESHTQAKVHQAAQPLPSAPQPQNPAPVTAAVNQKTSNPTPAANPIASAASLAPRQETPAPPSRLHAGHVKPEPVAERASPPAQVQQEKEHGAYFLQAGAFSREANASALQQQLMHAGYAAQVTRHAVNGRDWYIVTVGDYASESSARSAAHRIGQRLGVHPAVRR